MIPGVAMKDWVRSAQKMPGTLVEYSDSVAVHIELAWSRSPRSKGGWMSDERLGAVADLEADEQQLGIE